MMLQHDRDDRNRRLAGARASLDPVLRRQIHGPIVPMDKPGLLERLFGLR